MGKIDEEIIATYVSYDTFLRENVSLQLRAPPKWMGSERRFCQVFRVQSATREQDSKADPKLSTGKDS